ncbi:MAG: flagellar motor protein MotB [Synergistaceae bacterium]|jgi:chemotaxis protein MotB|nr:flagellar motor protein MotB [Synergistaceae bacterium]
MARRKKSEGGGGGGAPAWMSTYGDMVTLLLCFFVLLYSFSNIDAKKFEQIAASMQNAFNIQPGGMTQSSSPSIDAGAFGESPGDAPRPTDSDQSYNSREVLALMQNVLKDEIRDDGVTVSVNERGVVISMSEQVLFDEGSAKLHPESLRILYKIGAVLNELPNQISVEGHTDSGVPLRSIYIDNWGLSSARAARVTAYLNESIKLPQNRLRAVGMGASAPLVPNNSETNMRLNRRVDIVILSVHPVR